MQLLRCAVAMGFLATIALAAPADSTSDPWVKQTANGTLVYKTLPTGDRIMDFSTAGYMGGGVALPKIPVVKTLSPVPGDSSEEIQDAIDALAHSPAKNGVRGAILLTPGTYNCEHTINIRAGSIVLRGEGDQTILNLTGQPHRAIAISGYNHEEQIGESTAITDSYIPSGTASFHVASTEHFKVGDSVAITRPVTKAWVHFMQMDTLVRNNRHETWLSTSSNIVTHRHISAINGTEVRIDVPLSDSLDAQYLNPPGCSVVKVSITGWISQSAVEDLKIQCLPQAVPIDVRSFGGISLRGAEDCWVKDVSINNTIGKVSVDNDCAQITLEHVVGSHAVGTTGAPKPADFSVGGTQVLLERCECTGENSFYFVTDARAVGPIVLLDCTFHGHGWIQPHQRWATGLLLDNCHVPDGGIELMNRGIMGSGHGWTLGWSVAWNCSAKSLTIQKPPGSMNWAIGCQGEFTTNAMPGGSKTQLPTGIIESVNEPVQPRSLYRAQLKARLGLLAERNSSEQHHN